MTYYVYILKSEKDGRFYIGQTQDIETRLESHNSGRSVYTRGKGPWRLFAVKEVCNRSEAMLVEKQLKNLRSTRRISEFVVKHDFKRY